MGKDGLLQGNSDIVIINKKGIDGVGRRQMFFACKFKVEECTTTALLQIQQPNTSRKTLES